jgi:hypothetical protein
MQVKKKCNFLQLLCPLGDACWTLDPSVCRAEAEPMSKKQFLKEKKRNRLS